MTLTRAFWMQSTEVTQAEWKALMGNNPATYKGWPWPDNLPVETVTWTDALLYANALSANEGLTPCYTILDEAVKVNAGGGNPYGCTGYRLPTEAEWEYAYRAGSATAFYNGGITTIGFNPVDPKLDAIGWYRGNADSKTHSVRQKQANTWGLYDMSGNVWEWAWDWHASYPSGPVTDPQGPQYSSVRVSRGGSWFNDALKARAAYRGSFPPNNHNYVIGFRLARSRP